MYVKDEQVVQIEGNPDSPISRGRLCPKGSASKQLVTGPAAGAEGAATARRTPRVVRARPRDRDGHGRPHRFLEARRKGWQDVDPRAASVRRTLGLASLGGATLDNEENYLIKKLFTAAGAIQIENQARI